MLIASLVAERLEKLGVLKEISSTDAKGLGSNCSGGHNVLVILNVLQSFSFIKSKTEHNGK